VIVVPGPLDAPADRLLAALAARGLPAAVTPNALPEGAEPVTLAVSTGPFVFDFAGLVASLRGRPFRVLLLSRLGAHPDARTPSLQRLWRLEEHVRGGGAPTLTLRFAPLLGPDAPLWRRLRSRPGLPRGGRMLLNPALESDAVETLARALDGRAAWEGWYEVAGPEVWNLAELRDLAAAAGRAADAGEWEPSLDEMAEHRLAEAGPWTAQFGIVPGGIAAALGARAA
jgi:uncharacterized protein YbjT (DUF2867 family)